MRWSIVESEGGEFGYNLVLTGPDGIGQVRYAAKDAVAAQNLKEIIENDELFTGGFFAGRLIGPRAEIKNTKRQNKRA